MNFSNQIIFYIGIILMVSALILAIICFFLRKIQWLKLSNQLDQEYGKRNKKKNRGEWLNE